MKNKTYWFGAGIVGVAFLISSIQFAGAQVYSGTIVGYVNRVFYPGENFFENPLLASTNTLSSLFPGNSIVPDGTMISIWDSSTESFDTTSTFSGGAWSIDLTLLPGTGVKLTTSAQFINTFVGTALDHDGSPLTSADPTMPPLFSGPAGVYFLGDKAPTGDVGNDIFLNIFGRLPNAGEQVTVLDSTSQTYITSTCLGNGLWDSEPMLNVGGAAFLTINSAINFNAVPEPRAGILLFTGLVVVAGFGAWRQKVWSH